MPSKRVQYWNDLLLVRGVVLAALFVLPGVHPGAQERSSDLEDSAAAGGGRLAVIPFVDATADDEWQHVARSMAHTIELTLALSGRYDVVPSVDAEFDPYGADGPTELRRLAEELRLDAAIVGRLSPNDGDRIEIEAAVWNAADGRLIGRQRREAFGSFDIPDAADELVVVLTSALLGYRVDFGAVVLEPQSSVQDFRVRIDGHPVGVGVQSIPQVLVGRRRIDIRVPTRSGSRLIFSAEQQIEAGEAATVAFALPGATDAEIEAVSARHTLSRNLLGDPQRFRTAFEALSESRVLLASSTVPEDSVLRSDQQELERIWLLEEEFHKLSPADVNLDGRYTMGSPNALMSGSARLAASPARVSAQAIRRRIERNGTALYHLLRLRWTYELSAGNVDSARQVRDDMATVLAVFGLEQLAESHVEEDRSFDAAISDGVGGAERAAVWPYFGLMVGVGGIGFGTYTILNEIDVAGDNAGSRTAAVQVGGIAAGIALTLASVDALVGGSSPAQRSAREWVLAEHAQTVAVAERLFEESLEGDEDTAGVLIVGPVTTIFMAEGTLRSPPALVEFAPGRAIEISQPTVPSGDRLRLWPPGVSVLVLE